MVKAPYAIRLESLLQESGIGMYGGFQIGSSSFKTRQSAVSDSVHRVGLAVLTPQIQLSSNIRSLIAS